MATNDEKSDKKLMQKICDHMNSDHKDALSYYLLYYSKINARPKYCNLLSIDAGGMVIEYKDGAKQRIQFETPASTPVEVRRTLDAMLLKAYNGLGLSPHQVTTFRFSWAQALMLGASTYLFGTFISSVTVTRFEPFIRGLVPSEYRRLAAWSIPLIHLTEFTVWMLPVLIRHRVPKEKSAMWFAANIFCGNPSILTLRDLAREGEKTS